ncbi:hypothetical protein RJ639_046359 [Escallonia herrerae]|uniref:Pentatricopeptide repeat-containing protein n=1 Tax=Escallonia herrerae TaxID=1293975 RepID=A0AA88WFT5_9ASTE|nr:hypothetical protein RJ639_046359 [Escallonia herrerae]
MRVHKWPKDLKPILSACKAASSIDKVHALMLSSGVFSHGTFNGQLITSYIRIGDIDIAHKVFDKSPKRGVDAWNAFIVHYSRQSRPVEVISLYQKMSLEEACASIGDTRMGLSVHGCIIRRDLLMDVALQTSLVDMYAKNGSLELASCVFRKMHRKSGVSWSALISGYAQNGVAEDALEFFIEMQCFGFKPDLVSLIVDILEKLEHEMSAVTMNPMNPKTEFMLNDLKEEV